MYHELQRRYVHVTQNATEATMNYKGGTYMFKKSTTEVGVPFY
jgi:hypothetical protein